MGVLLHGEGSGVWVPLSAGLVYRIPPAQAITRISLLTPVGDNTSALLLPLPYLGSCNFRIWLSSRCPGDVWREKGYKCPPGKVP